MFELSMNEKEELVTICDRLSFLSCQTHQLFPAQFQQQAGSY
jgi:hypothetical protein